MKAVLYDMPGDFGKRFDIHWGDLIYSSSKVFSEDFDRKERVGFRIMSFIDYDNPRAHVNTGDNEFLNPRSDLDLVTLYIKSYLKEMDLESAVKCYRMDPPLVSIMAVPFGPVVIDIMYNLSDKSKFDAFDKFHFDLKLFAGCRRITNLYISDMLVKFNDNDECKDGGKHERD